MLRCHSFNRFKYQFHAERFYVTDLERLCTEWAEGNLQVVLGLCWQLCFLSVIFLDIPVCHSLARSLCEKLNDLRQLLPYIPAEFEDFYNDIINWDTGDIIDGGGGC